MDKKDVGILLNPNNLKLQRFYFNQMLRLQGITAYYRAPRKDKTYDGYGDLNTFYYEPIETKCIFVEHPTQYTMKKLGWNSELQEEASLIQISYDLKGIQRGGLFVLPSGLDNAPGRTFEVIEMSTIGVTPAYITCKIGPLWENVHDIGQNDYSNSNFNLLDEEVKEDGKIEFKPLNVEEEN